MYKRQGDKMAGKKSEKRKYSHSQQLLDKRLGLLLMVPIAAVIFGITGIPFIRALYLSFTNKVVGVPEQFIGFDNYLALFLSLIHIFTLRWWWFPSSAFWPCF